MRIKSMYTLSQYCSQNRIVLYSALLSLSSVLRGQGVPCRRHQLRRSSSEALLILSHTSALLRNRYKHRHGQAKSNQKLRECLQFSTRPGKCNLGKIFATLPCHVTFLFVKLNWASEFRPFLWRSWNTLETLIFLN